MIVSQKNKIWTKKNLKITYLPQGILWKMYYFNIFIYKIKANKKIKGTNKEIISLVIKITNQQQNLNKNYRKKRKTKFCCMEVINIKINRNCLKFRKETKWHRIRNTMYLIDSITKNKQMYKIFYSFNLKGHL